MAKEINVRISMNATKGGVSINTVGISSPELTQIDMAGDDMAQFSQVIPPTGAALAIPADVNPIGKLEIRNCDSTNAVNLSVTAGSAFADGRFSTLRPGHSMIYQPYPGTTINVLPVSGSVRVAVAAVEV